LYNDYSEGGKIIVQIDKMLVQDVRDEVIQALRAIAARHGLDVEQQKNVTYYDDHFGIKYTFTDASIDVAKNEWEKKCWKYGLQAKHYGLTFTNGSDTITLTGINTRAPKYPIQFTKNGVGRKAGPEHIRRLLIDNGLM
jgi:hypothetical protein